MCCCFSAIIVLTHKRLGWLVIERWSTIDYLGNSIFGNKHWDGVKEKKRILRKRRLLMKNNMNGNCVWQQRMETTRYGDEG